MLIKLVAALIEKDNKVLIAKRSTGNPNVYGKWKFPGGKVELDKGNNKNKQYSNKVIG